MPYTWSPDPERLTSLKTHAEEEPILRLGIWPHRSLPNKGFKAAIWLMFAAGVIPVLAFIGTSAFWVLLLCLMGTLLGLLSALRHSDRIHLREELLVWPNKITLSHWDLKNNRHYWEANPHWAQLKIHPTSGPVEQYLTLTDRGPNRSGKDTRIVELAAFISPEERVTLMHELSKILQDLS